MTIRCCLRRHRIRRFRHGVEFELFTRDTLRNRYGTELSVVPQPGGRGRAMLFSTEEQLPAQCARELLDACLRLAAEAARRPGDRLAALA